MYDLIKFYMLISRFKNQRVLDPQSGTSGHGKCELVIIMYRSSIVSVNQFIDRD